MKPDARIQVGRILFLFLVPFLAMAQDDAAPPAAPVPAEEDASEETLLTRRAEDIRRQLRALEEEQRDIQGRVMESHRAQQELQQGVVEDEDLAALRLSIAEKEKELQELRAKFAEALTRDPRFAEIKSVREGAFARRSEILRQENALSEELVRVDIRLKELRSESPSGNED